MSRSGGHRRRDPLKPPILRSSGAKRRQEHNKLSLLEKFVNALRRAEFSGLYGGALSDRISDEFHYLGDRDELSVAEGSSGSCDQAGG